MSDSIFRINERRVIPPEGMTRSMSYSSVVRQVCGIDDWGVVWTNDEATPAEVREGLSKLLLAYARYANRLAAALPPASVDALWPEPAAPTPPTTEPPA